MALRNDDLIREHLLQQLPAAGESAVVVVTAPGGWGKSTMLATWNEWASNLQFCWRPLTKADDDPKRFVTRLMAVAEELTGDLVWGPEAELTAEVWVEEILPRFCERLTAKGPVAVVFDNYHEISSAVIHNIVQALLDALPPAISVVISTRADPPLRLARLRAARRVHEWRASDLSFSTGEAGTLLRDSFGLQLDDGDLQLLVAKTEGWPAAISLAARALQGVDDPNVFLHNFLASDRYLIDFLAEELIAVLSAEQQTFMTATSVVDRFSPDLGRVLSEQDDSEARCHDLERRGLLTAELRDGRMWFRYHQLVRQYLYGRLPAEARPGLHRRAAEWFETADLPRLAIDQLIGGNNHKRANELIGRHGASYIMRGRNATVMHWVEAQCRAGQEQAGTLLIGAQAAIYGGAREQGKAWLARAERHDRLEPAERVVALLLRATLANADGRIADAALAADQLVQSLDCHVDDRSITLDGRAEGYFVAANALAYAGKTVEAVDLADRCLLVGLPHKGHRISAVSALGLKAFLAYLDGDTANCRSLIDQAFTLADRFGLARTSLSMRFSVVLKLLVGDDDEAADILADAHRFELAYSPYGIACTHLTEAHYFAKVGDQQAAQEALSVARDLLDEVEQPSPTSEQYYALINNSLPNPAVTALPQPGALSNRELQVLQALGSNLTQREIGRELFLSFNTIKTYTRSAYRKLGVRSRAEAVARCRELGLY